MKTMNYVKQVLIVLLLYISHSSYTFAKVNEMTIYRTASCSCCKDWTQYIKQSNKYKVTVVSVTYDELEQIKNKFNIPTHLRGCHSAQIGQHFIEGHVPLKEIAWLIKQNEKIKGVSVPGMPVGSPGMTSGYDSSKTDYKVTAIKKDGTTKVIAHYPQKDKKK